MSPATFGGFPVEFFLAGYPTAGETTAVLTGNAVSAITGKGLLVDSTTYPIARAPAFNGSSTQVDWTGIAFVAGNTYTVDVAGAGPDVTAPTITSSSTASVAENSVLAYSVTTDEAATITIVGGADQARFELSGTTLRWTSNGTKDFEAPNDADLNNVYVVTLRATDAAGNWSEKTVSVTVTDVAEYDGPIWRASAALSNGTTSVTPALPTRSLKDRLILSIVTPNQAVTVPSDWEAVLSIGTGTPGDLTAVSVSIYTREVDGTETAPTITGTTDHILAQITSLSECELHVTGSSVLATASTTCSFPTPTTTRNSNLQFAIGAVSTDIATARASAWTNTFTERFDGATTTGNGGGLFGATKQVITAGTIGATQATVATSSTQAKLMLTFVKKYNYRSSTSASLRYLGNSLLTRYQGAKSLF